MCNPIGQGELFDGQHRVSGVHYYIGPGMQACPNPASVTVDLQARAVYPPAEGIFTIIDGEWSPSRLGAAFDLRMENGEQCAIQIAPTDTVSCGAYPFKVLHCSCDDR